MKKQITIMALGLMFMVGAMAMYSGESYEFQTNLTSPVYTVSGNSSNLEGLTVQFNNGNITISTNPLMGSDSFKLLFFDEVTNEVTNTVYVGGGGGGSRTRYVDRNVTVYVPEYINTTTEVEKIVEKEIMVEDSSLFNPFTYFLLAVIALYAVTSIIGPKDEVEDEEERTND